MTHEPECPMSLPKVSPMDFHLDFPQDCICDELRAAYRRGYNDHARAAQHWQDTHGAYRADPQVVKKSEANILNSPVADSAARLTPQIMREHFNQHGEGTNP